MNKEYVVLLATKVNQPIGSFYTSVIEWNVLRDVTYVDERIFIGYDDDNKEVYRGIQRALSDTRKKEITAYVNRNPNATFPSSILLNIPFERIDVIEMKSEASLDLDSKTEWETDFPIDAISHELLANQYCLVFPLEKGIAQIIDGQHRMSGFSDETTVQFDLPVTVFIDQIPEEQAEIFAIINGKQTRVAPSLVYDLFGLSKTRNPFSVAHNITKLLNEGEDSPLNQWIRRLGKSNELYKGYLTQSTVVKNILDLICGNIKQAEEDKISMLKGESLLLEMTYTKKSAPLRKYFIAGEDEIIYKVLKNYFCAVRDTQQSDWEDPETVLKKTIGFVGLIKIAKELIAIGQEENNLTYDFFKIKFSNVTNKLKDVDIQLSSVGINQVYNHYKSILD